MFNIHIQDSNPQSHSQGLSSLKRKERPWNEVVHPRICRIVSKPDRVGTDMRKIGLRTFAIYLKFWEIAFVA